MKVWRLIESGAKSSDYGMYYCIWGHIGILTNHLTSLIVDKNNVMAPPFPSVISAIHFYISSTTFDVHQFWIITAFTTDIDIDS